MTQPDFRTLLAAEGMYRRKFESGACGVARGASLVWAIRDGRDVAASIQSWLKARAMGRAA